MDRKEEALQGYAGWGWPWGSVCRGCLLKDFDNYFSFDQWGELLPNDRSEFGVRILKEELFDENLPCFNAECHECGRKLLEVFDSYWDKNKTTEDLEKKMENTELKAKSIAHEIAKVLDHYHQRTPKKSKDGWEFITDDDVSVITVFNDAEKLKIEYTKGTIPAVAAQQVLNVERRWGSKIKVIVSDFPYGDVSWDELLGIDDIV